jgi:hypothetical protein
VFVDSHTSKAEVRTRQANDSATVNAWTQSHQKEQAEAATSTREPQVTFGRDTTRIIANTVETVTEDIDHEEVEAVE